MREAQVVQKTEVPATIESLQHELSALGVRDGMTLLVHSSLRAIGWVSGGAVAVILALQETLGSTGTLVMPAYSTDLSEPSKWENPPVPESWWPLIRETMPAYDAALTPTRSMGLIAETFRKQKNVLRTTHPQNSFCASGPKAGHIIENHSLEFGLGEQSPLARIYELHGSVLLLGVGHARNTSMHLSEYRANFSTKRIIQDAAPIFRNGSRVWKVFEEINLDSSDFEHIGADFLRAEAGQAARHGKVGLANCQIIPQRDIVDFATDWMQKNRIKSAKDCE